MWVTDVLRNQDGLCDKATINIYMQPSSLQMIFLSFHLEQWKTWNNATNVYIVPLLSSISNKGGKAEQAKLFMNVTVEQLKQMWFSRSKLLPANCLMAPILVRQVSLPAVFLSWSILQSSGDQSWELTWRWFSLKRSVSLSSAWNSAGMNGRKAGLWEQSAFLATSILLAMRGQWK